MTTTPKLTATEALKIARYALQEIQVHSAQLICDRIATDALRLTDGAEDQSMSELIATHQAPKAKHMAELCANAGPSKGDMPIDRFVSTLPRPQIPAACSVCYGTGRGVDGKRCPFDCAPQGLMLARAAIDEARKYDAEPAPEQPKSAEGEREES